MLQDTLVCGMVFYTQSHCRGEVHTVFSNDHTLFSQKVMCGRHSLITENALFGTELNKAFMMADTFTA